MLPYQRYLRTDILFPGCEFDCRLTITGYSGMLLHTKVPSMFPDICSKTFAAMPGVRTEDSNPARQWRFEDFSEIERH